MKYQVMPPLSTEEYDSLKASIELEGIRDPVVKDEEGNILDGHHRYKIAPNDPKCNEEAMVLEGLSEAEKLAFAIRSNIARRNMSGEQKKELQKRQKETAKLLRQQDPKKFTNAVVGAMLGVAESTIRYWLDDTNANNRNLANTCADPEEPDSPTEKGGTEKEQIKEPEPPKPPPDARVTISKEHYPYIYERIENGETQEEVAADYKVKRQRISQIYNNYKKKIEQERAIEEAAQRYIENPEKYKILHGDFYEICKDIAGESIDHIITDLPYPKEHLPLWSQLAEVAARVLKPGGFCIAYSGQLHLPEAMRRLSEHLTYYWTFSLILSGNRQLIQARNVICTWKPLLIYQKPPFAMLQKTTPDIVSGSGREKDLYEWQQGESELANIIASFTNENDLILEPFAGSGTTLTACLKMGRRVIGIEKDKKRYTITKGRVHDAVGHI